MHPRVELALRDRWEAIGRPQSGWVNPGPKGTPYTIQSLWAALLRAEEEAGVQKKKGRGGHGLRRLLAGDVAAVTGNPKMALDAIRDRDPRMLDRYVQRRDQPLREHWRRSIHCHTNHIQLKTTTPPRCAKALLPRDFR
jgi:hypothetical protein